MIKCFNWMEMDWGRMAKTKAKTKTKTNINWGIKDFLKVTFEAELKPLLLNYAPRAQNLSFS